MSSALPPRVARPPSLNRENVKSCPARTITVAAENIGVGAGGVWDAEPLVQHLPLRMLGGCLQPELRPAVTDQRCAGPASAKPLARRESCSDNNPLCVGTSPCVAGARPAKCQDQPGNYANQAEQVRRNDHGYGEGHQQAE